MMVHDQIAALMSIAELAIEVDNRQTAVKHRKIALNHAYNAWKDENCIEHVERDSPEWEAMLRATKSDYEELDKAKREDKNTRRRLANAIRRYRDAARNI